MTQMTAYYTGISSATQFGVVPKITKTKEPNEGWKRMVRKEKGGLGAETRTMRKRRKMGMMRVEHAYNFSTAHIIYHHSYNIR